MKDLQNHLQISTVRTVKVFYSLILGFILLPGIMTSQLSRLTSGELSRDGHFGRKLDVHNNFICVSEPNFTDTTTHMGRVHLYTREAQVWVHAGIVENPTLKAYSHFGYDLSIHADELVISAPDYGSGKVFIYSKPESTWDQIQELSVPSHLHREIPFIKFGENVEHNESWLAIRAPGYLGNNDGITRTGAVFIYKKDGGLWQFHQMLLPPDLSKSTQFGNDMEFDGTSFLVSAAKGEGGVDNSGVVYLYKLEGSIWALDYTFINPSSRQHELFGADVDMHDNTIVIGAPMHTEDLSVGPVGAVHVYQKFDDTWIRTALLEPSDGKRNDMYGSTVVAEAGNIFVGAPRHDEPGKADVGKVYHYIVENAFWNEKITHSPPPQDAQEHMHFGGTMSLHDHQLAISAHLMNNLLDDSGIAYTTDVEVITGTDEEVLAAQKIMISPNPATDVIHIHLDGIAGPEISFAVYSQDGRAHLRKELTVQSSVLHQAIDVSALTPGIYFLHVMNGNKISLHKWIKI